MIRKSSKLNQAHHHRSDQREQAHHQPIVVPHHPPPFDPADGMLDRYAGARHRLVCRLLCLCQFSAAFGLLVGSTNLGLLTIDIPLVRQPRLVGDLRRQWRLLIQLDVGLGTPMFGVKGQDIPLLIRYKLWPFRVWRFFLPEYTCCCCFSVLGRRTGVSKLSIMATATSSGVQEGSPLTPLLLGVSHFSVGHTSRRTGTTRGKTFSVVS